MLPISNLLGCLCLIISCDGISDLIVFYLTPDGLSFLRVKIAYLIYGSANRVTS